MTTGRINQITILSLLQLLTLKECSPQKISQVFKRFNSSEWIKFITRKLQRQAWTNSIMLLFVSFTIRTPIRCNLSKTGVEI